MALFGPPDVAALKGKRDVQGLIKALAYTGDPAVRRAAAAALAELGDVRAVEPLCLALRRSDWGEHEWQDTSVVADALVRFGAPAVGPLIATLEWHSKVVRVSVAGALAAIGRPAVQPLIALLGDSDLENRETASVILTDIGADAVDPLIDALHDELIGRRQRAARILGDIGDERAVEALVGSLRDSLAGVRQAGARSLGQIADVRALDYLAAILKDTDPAVRRAAALALAEMHDPRGVETLLPELRGQKPQPVLNALVNVGVPAVEPLVTMLAGSVARGDAAWLVDELRSDLAKVLAAIGYPQAVAGLVLQLFVEDAAERIRAAAELVRLRRSDGLDDQAKALIRFAAPVIDQALADDAAAGAA